VRAQDYFIFCAPACCEVVLSSGERGARYCLLGAGLLPFSIFHYKFGVV